MDNSRKSYRQIAQKAGVSVATVMKRVDKWKKQGAIRKYSALLDFDELGYETQVAVEMRVRKGRLLDVERRVADHPNVYGVYDITGDFDVLVLARFKNRKSLDSFIKRIQTFDFVERTETRFILNTIKEAQIEL